LADPLKIPPAALLDPRTGDISRVWRDLLEGYAMSLDSFPWTSLDFTGSNLQDILTRNHISLQNIEQADETSSDTTKDKHVSDNQLKVAYDDIDTNSTDIATNATNIADNAVSIKSNRVLLWLSM